MLRYQAERRSNVDGMLAQRSVWLVQQAKEFGVDADLIRAVVKYKSLKEDFRPSPVAITSAEKESPDVLSRTIKSAAVWLGEAKKQLQDRGVAEPSSEQILDQYAAQRGSEEPRGGVLLRMIYKYRDGEAEPAAKKDAAAPKNEGEKSNKGPGFFMQVPSGSWIAPTGSLAEMAEDNAEYWRQVGEVFLGYKDVTIGAAQEALEAMKNAPTNLADLTTTVKEQAKMGGDTLWPTLVGAGTETGKAVVENAKEFGGRLLEGDDRAAGQLVGTLLTLLFGSKNLRGLVKFETNAEKATKVLAQESSKGRLPSGKGHSREKTFGENTDGTGSSITYSGDKNSQGLVKHETRVDKTSSETTPASETVPLAEGKSVAGTKASFGKASTKNYRRTFFLGNPELKGRVVIHHAVEQKVMKKFPGVVSELEMHSVENLRGIPLESNVRIHLSQIRKSWNQFYRRNPRPTKEQLLRHATTIDDKFGHIFLPRVR